MFFQQLGATAAPTTPQVFFNSQLGLKTLDANGDEQGEYDGGEFIGPYPDNALFNVIKNKMASVFIVSSGAESNPGINIVLTQAKWEQMSAAQQAGWKQVNKTYNTVIREQFDENNLAEYEKSYLNDPNLTIADFNKIEVEYDGSTKTVQKHLRDIWRDKRTAYAEDAADPHFDKLMSSIDKYQALYQSGSFWLKDTAPFYPRPTN